MSRFFLVASFAAFALACQSGAPLGTSCTINSACGAPLVCRLGRCRNECTANRDCPIGAQCFLDGAGLGACQLDVDRSCGTQSCGAGLTCLGSECVRACGVPSECPADGVCTIASGASIGVCSDPRATSDAGVPLDDGGPVDAAVSCTPLDARQVCTGIGFSCAIRVDQSVVCWGLADAGILGVAPPATLCDTVGGPTPCARTPIAIPLEESGALVGAVELACGDDFACARLDTGHVRCWGRNYAGMLGVMDDGIRGARQVIDALGVPLDGATQLVAGSGHACVLRGATDVSCWGMNGLDQLGRGAPSVGELAGAGMALVSAGSVVAIATMGADTCVVHDGTSRELHCLGDNGHGQLAVDAATLSVSPALRRLDMVMLGPTAAVVTGGDAFGCAIDSGRHVQCWGWNDNGALGRHLSVAVDAPAPGPLYGVAGTRTFDTLFTGPTRLTTCGVSGTDLFCWGPNGAGQAARDPALGDTVDPTIVVGVPAMAQGSCGQQGCCGVDTMQRVWCWGANDVGQLGRGTATSLEFVPAPVCAP